MALAFEMFQFLIGSLEVLYRPVQVSRSHQFQFLIGSLEVRMAKDSTSGAAAVSIPYR